MKAIIVCALLAVAAVGCTTGYRQASNGETYIKSNGLFGTNDTLAPAQRMLPQQPQQIPQVQYPAAE